MNQPTFTRFPVLFEDSWLIAVDKPAGVISHPNPGKSHPPRKSAFEGSYCADGRRFETPAGPIFLMHRLDQDTSGVLLGAKEAGIAKIIRTYFENQQIQKTYLALVLGKPAPMVGAWKDHIQKRSDREMVRSTIAFGRHPNAELQYKVQRIMHLPSLAKNRFSLLEILLITGRTHQIRVQASSRKYFIAGDRVYGDFNLNRQLRKSISLRRLFLHARRLRLKHPILNKTLILESSLPEELNSCLARISHYQNSYAS